MRRRDLLRAAGIAGIALLAGCTGSADPGSRRSDAPGPPEAPETPEDPEDRAYRIETYDYNAGEDGPLVVSVTVENRGDRAPPATLAATVEIDGESERRARELDVSPGTAETYDLTFGITVPAFETRGSLTLRLR